MSGWYNAPWQEKGKEFVAVLKCISYYTGGSSVNWIFEDPSGQEYNMHMSDYWKMIGKGINLIPNIPIVAKWKVVKKGSSYGIMHLSELENCVDCGNPSADITECSYGRCAAKCCPNCLKNGECSHCRRSNIFS